MLVCAHKGGLLLVWERVSWTMEGPKATSSFALQYCQAQSISLFNVNVAACVALSLQRVRTI